MAKKFYVTTAIDYVNARPHIGHAFEKVLADALVRWHRLLGEEVWFLTGTDENAQKNALAAKEKDVDVKKFVDQHSKIFVELCEKLNISYDRFIRTTEEEHKKKSQEIFKKVTDNGDIYKGNYEGFYCQGCEGFKTEKDLVDGKCPEHNINPEWISEDAHFFRLSKYKNKILEFARDYIVPESKKNEIIARLENEELKDLSVSRINLDWGIDVPGEKGFKIYVWFDALINYISGSDGNWPADIHVIGKGINWFHSVIWPGMLISAGYKLPKKLLVHGYLNLGGKKISKSLGNIIDPIELSKRYGSDSIRYSLLRCSVFEDSDYSEEILIERHNNELANKLGNLVSRVTSLAEKINAEKVKNTLLDTLRLKEIEKHFENYEPDKALHLIFAFIDACNEYVQEKKPWENRDGKVLYELVDSIKAIAILLWPFIPETSEKIAKHLGFEIKYDNIKKPLKVKKMKKADILFKKIG
jgi:methionyl-tRNA synthetase